VSLKLAIQAAEKGLAWLKESGPIYGLDVNQVDIERLDISAQCSCVLGQLGQDYGTVMRKLIADGAIGSDLFERIEWASEHGFDGGNGVKYHHLDEAWRLVLKADRAQ
jgi:hypothetical protein